MDGFDNQIQVQQRIHGICSNDILRDVHLIDDNPVLDISFIEREKDFKEIKEEVHIQQNL